MARSGARKSTQCSSASPVWLPALLTAWPPPYLWGKAMGDAGSEWRLPSWQASWKAVSAGVEEVGAAMTCEGKEERDPCYQRDEVRPMEGDSLSEEDGDSVD
ncbi:hypothetical protein DFJ77DRAFT_440754 [Powellomyces hirtus]|nr:hypothetical protein DFJ77DRAFT_440754 [Powellomyces hirtus]